MCDDVYTRLSQNSFNSPVLFVHAHHQLRRMLLQILPDPRNCGPVQKYKQHRWFKVTAIYIERNYVRNTAFSLSRKGRERLEFFKHYPISARESTLCTADYSERYFGNSYQTSSATIRHVLHGVVCLKAKRASFLRMRSIC